MQKKNLSTKDLSTVPKQAKTLPLKNRIIAWGVHLFTTTGVLCALFAAVDIMQHHARFALLWLLLAQIIDGLDGPMARKFNVRKYAPSIDGNILDLVIDYMTTVVVPVFFALQFNLYPYHGELVIASLIMATSVLWYAKTDLETEDAWFKGFPAQWNLVITMLWLLQASQKQNLIISLIFVVFTLTPRVKFFHILSSPQLRRVTVPYTIITFSFAAWMVRMHRHSITGLVVILSWVVYALCLTAWRSLQPDDYAHVPKRT